MYFDDLTVEFSSGTSEVTALETGGSTDVAEGGAVDIINVLLASMPSQNVTVTPVFDGDQLSVTPPAATIQPSGWETPIGFTVSAVDDDDIEGPHTSGVSFSTSSSDSAYDGLSTSNVVVHITDNDVLVQPIITGLTNDGVSLRFTFHTELNQQYVVEETDDLVVSNWVIRAGPFPGFGLAEVPVTLADTNQSLIRVNTEPLP